MGFALLGFLVALIVKDVPLREELDTEYGLEVKKKKNRDADIGVCPGTEDPVSRRRE
ncbi:hypothetical protein V8F20_012835 [Naviculisporaceae sp. PSN 640]